MTIYIHRIIYLDSTILVRRMLREKTGHIPLLQRETLML